MHPAVTDRTLHDDTAPQLQRSRPTRAVRWLGLGVGLGLVSLALWPELLEPGAGAEAQSVD